MTLPVIVPGETPYGEIERTWRFAAAACVKFAVTDLFAFIVRQLLASSASPDHPAKDQPAAGVAVRQI